MRGRQAWTLIGLLSAFLLARLAILAGATIFTSYDSYTYAPRADAAVDRGGLVSLTGDSPRLWGVPAFFALFPDDQARAVGQWALGTIAWAVLAWVLWTSLRSLLAKVLGAGAALVFGLLAPVANWDFAILSESLTISLGVLTLALLLRWLGTRERWALVAMTAVAVWWTFTRPDIRPFVGVVLVVVAAIAWRRRDLTAAVASGVLVLAALWCSLIVPATNDSFQRWGALGVTQDEELFIYRLRLHVFNQPEVEATFSREFGMPPCPGANRVAAGATWEIREFAREYRACPGLRDWARTRGPSAFREWAVVAPGQYARYLLDSTQRSLGGATYAGVPHVVPRAGERVVFAPWRWSLPSLAAGFAVVLLAAIATGTVRRRPILLWTGVGLFAVSIVSAVAGVLFAAGEYNRFGVQEAIFARLGLVLIALAVVDVVGQRRTSSAPEQHRRAEPVESTAA